MKVLVVTPERDRPDEHEVVERLFELGLVRLHLRKPYASREEFARWIARISPQWRSRLVLHQHHDIAAEFGVGGVHWRDTPTVGGALCPDPTKSESAIGRGITPLPQFRSRSCHDLESLRASMGAYDAVVYGPIFPSISKKGYISNDAAVAEVAAFLQARADAQRRTEVIAIGGIMPERVGAAAKLGFDGVAALGAVWQADDPVQAFVEIQTAVGRGLRSALSSAATPVAALPN